MSKITESRRALHLIIAIVTVLILGNLLTFTTKSNRYSESYPAVVCAGNTAGQSSVIALSSPKTQVRKTGVSTLAYKDSRTRRLAGNTQATVIDAQAITPISWQVRTGIWAGGLTCLLFHRNGLLAPPLMSLLRERSHSQIAVLGALLSGSLFTPKTELPRRRSSLSKPTH
jgi:hypothetical protein